VLGERKFEFVEGDGEISSLGTEEIEEDKILNGKQSPFWKGEGKGKGWGEDGGERVERNLFREELEPVAEINQSAWMSFTKARVAVKPQARPGPSQDQKPSKDPKPSSWLKGRMLDPVTGVPMKRSNMTVDAETAEIILTNFNKMPGDDNRLGASRGHR
jgi:hypothetical protein